jgi:hypothetical protein
MASGKSTYLENALLNAALQNAAFSVGKTTLYVALTTASPTAASTGSSIVEPTDSTYARQAVTSASGWSPTPATAGTVSNAGTLSYFGSGIATTAATITSIAICDAATLGNMLYFADLTGGPKTVAVGDTASIAAGALTITES